MDNVTVIRQDRNPIYSLTIKQIVKQAIAEIKNDFAKNSK